MPENEPNQCKMTLCAKYVHLSIQNTIKIQSKYYQITFKNGLEKDQNQLEFKFSEFFEDFQSILQNERGSGAAIFNLSLTYCMQMIYKGKHDLPEGSLSQYNMCLIFLDNKLD